MDAGNAVGTLWVVRVIRLWLTLRVGVMSDVRLIYSFISNERQPIANLLTDDEADSLILTDSLSTAQKVSHRDVLVNRLSTDTLPADKGPQLGGQITLTKDMVGDMSKLLKLELRVKLDALSNNRGSGIVDMNVAEPDGLWYILCLYVNRM